MTEAEARAWIVVQFGLDFLPQLDVLVEMVADEASMQNLVAASTLDTIWSRHIVDSAQLILFAQDYPGTWLDIGTGAGFPGLVVAILTQRPILLVEPRRRRVDFLRRVITRLEIEQRVTVEQRKIETVVHDAAVISARAVSRIEKIFAGGINCASQQTLWMLPKGRSTREEVAETKQSWHATFHVEHSITDPDSLIVIATGVSRR